ncbi:MAG: hypothetical protein J0L75_03785 [Spirochaetes bacterium]|nr:hypothetical protein [Spirochaetota bacterium]
MSANKINVGSIMARDFKHMNDLFIADCIRRKVDPAGTSSLYESFVAFVKTEPTEEIRDYFKKLYQLNPPDDLTLPEGQDVDDLWTTLSLRFAKEHPLVKKWHLSYRAKEADYLKAFLEKKMDETPCHYCGTNEKSIKLLIETGKLFSKRLLTRGRSLEVERKDPLKGYVDGNLEWACYWCNNTKTDSFDDADFKTIGDAIGQLFQKKLGEINQRQYLFKRRQYCPNANFAASQVMARRRIKSIPMMFISISRLEQIASIVVQQATARVMTRDTPMASIATDPMELSVFSADPQAMEPVETSAIRKGYTKNSKPYGRCIRLFRRPAQYYPCRDSPFFPIFTVI